MTAQPQILIRLRFIKLNVSNLSNLCETYGDIRFSDTQWLDPNPHHPWSWPLSAGRSSSVKRSITWGLALRWSPLEKKHRLNDPQQKVAILQLGIIESASISIQMAERSHEHPSFSTKSQTCDSRTSCSILPCFSPLLGMISNNGLLDSSFFIRSPRGVQNIPGDLTTSPDPQGSALPRHQHRILLKTAQEKGAIAVGCEEVEVWLPWRSVGWFFLGKM